MTVAWSLLTVVVGPAVLAFVFNTLLPEVAKKIAGRMAGPISDRAIDWFSNRFPRLGSFLFKKNPLPQEAEAKVEKPPVPIWYYSEATERRGPVTAAELRRLYSTGQLTSLSMVWKDGMPTWATLASVEDELPAPQKVKIELPPKKFAVSPGGVFLGLFVLFFIVLVIAVVGANLTLSSVAR